MSLDCYPLSERKTITLKEQPLALEAAYEEDLFISVVDQCQSIAVFDLNKQKLINSFRVGLEVLVEEVIYCPAGDYIACIGHKNGLLSIFTASNWRTTSVNDSVIINKLRVSELSVNVLESETQDFRTKITHLDCCRRSGNLAICCGDVILIYRYIDESKQHDNSSNHNETTKSETYFCHMISVKLSLWATQVRLTENYLAVAAVDHVQIIKLELLTLQIGQPSDYMGTSSSWNMNKKQITWNLNTRKLVKLPTLMQNTSTNLSSFHVCHPLELLGPASESIACRVSAPIYLPEYCQNQLEAIVMLCKQFEKGFVKSVSIQPVYLSQLSELDRLNISDKKQTKDMTADDSYCDQIDLNTDLKLLLKSKDNNLLVAVTCVITTLTNCFVYSLHGKKVVRSQTISHPDICVDSRCDLLNMYILTSLGLQVCSTGVCDDMFRYDWSSSAELNLSCVPMHRSKVLTTKKYILLVPSSFNGKCEIEFFKKPDLQTINKRILHVFDRCDSISVRANLLTYLHASAQLELLETTGLFDIEAGDGKILQSSTLLLCKQLLLKKQTNPIMNSKIDRAIKHLLDTSKCDLDELFGKMKRKMSSKKIDLETNNEELSFLSPREENSDFKSDSGESTEENSITEERDEEEKETAEKERLRVNEKRKILTRRQRVSSYRRSGRNASNEELIRIYSKMLDDLSVHSTDDNSSFSASFLRRQASSSSFGQTNHNGHVYSATNSSSKIENHPFIVCEDDSATCDTICALNQAGASDEPHLECADSSIVNASDLAIDGKILEQISEFDTSKWLELLSKCKDTSPDEWTDAKTRSYVNAKQKLLDAQFILDKMRQTLLNDTC